MFRKIANFFTRKSASHEDMQMFLKDMQVLLDKEKVRMCKTSEYRADPQELLDTSTATPSQLWANKLLNTGAKTAFTYKFYFDNMSRKRQFLTAITKYATQEWDPWIFWADEITVLKDIAGVTNEYIVEAKCLIPPDEVGRFRHTFETFVAKKLILEN